jgi:hypothetical protein
MRSVRTAVVLTTVALAAPAAASTATLTVEPVEPCYREGETVFMTAKGYTPNGIVEFTRGGELIERVRADPSGTIAGDLTLPGLLTGRHVLTYVGTDVADPALRAEVSLVTTATDVGVKPESGAPNRLLTINGRGFFGGRTVWAHVRRVGRRGSAALARTVRIGRVEGDCKRVEAKRRLFRRSTAPGEYRVQFDTFRRYKPKRKVEYDGLFVEILRP